jgi:hypothetical protein
MENYLKLQALNKKNIDKFNKLENSKYEVLRKR